MTKKLTQEEVSKLYAEQGYELISEYKNARSLLFVRDKEGYICSSIYNTFKQGNIPRKFYKNNPYTIQNIKLWMKSNAIGYELLSKKYKGNNKYLLFKCPRGHEFEMRWSNFQQGQRCPICSGNKTTEYNCIATTDPWMIELGMSREDAETHTRGSGDKVIVTCPSCGKKKEIIINKIYNRKSISCTCGDGVSYPEKFIISVLNQLGIEYQHDSYWIENKRYDFYFEYNNKKYIIETHGEQHYEQIMQWKNLNDEQKNDQYKKELALQNGIDKYIILDCRKSELNWIKNSVINSELDNIFNLNNIDWIQCEEFALSNRVKEVCDYWKLHSKNLTTVDIGKVFNLSRNTIIIYLKKGNDLKWCDYNAEEEKIKQSKINGKHFGKQVEILKDGKSLGVFQSCSELEKQSEELFGVKLLHSAICAVCRGEYEQYKGFTFKYI